MIAASAAVIIWESVDALINPRELTNLGWVFAAAVVGVLGNEAVATYRIRAGRRIGSAALIAEGYHARTDGFVSLTVVLAVIGVWLGFPQADAIVGLLIAVAILLILVNSSRMVLRRLMDGVDDGTIESIKAIAGRVDGVQTVDRVRARWSGHRLEAQLDLAVDGRRRASSSMRQATSCTSGRVSRWRCAGAAPRARSHCATAVTVGSGSPRRTQRLRLRCSGTHHASRNLRAAPHESRFN